MTLVSRSFGLYRCDVCEKGRTEARIVATVELDRDSAHCCEFCALEHNGPGKFEQHSVNLTLSGDGFADGGTEYDADELRAIHRDELNELGICLILYKLMQSSCQDDSMNNGFEWADRFDNRILFGNDQGFVWFEEYRSVEAAEKEWSRMYDNGLGANEEDAYVSTASYSGYDVSFEGKYLGTFESERRARAAISVEMRKSGYYPDAWYVNDHGNIHRIEVW